MQSIQRIPIKIIKKIRAKANHNYRDIYSKKNTTFIMVEGTPSTSQKRLINFVYQPFLLKNYSTTTLSLKLLESIQLSKADLNSEFSLIISVRTVSAFLLYFTKYIKP